MLLITAAALVVTGWMAVDSHRRHQRQLTLERLLQETCDECAARHQSVRRLRETLQQSEQVPPAPEAQ